MDPWTDTKIPHISREKEACDIWSCLYIETWDLNETGYSTEMFYSDEYYCKGFFAREFSFYAVLTTTFIQELDKQIASKHSLLSGGAAKMAFWDNNNQKEIINNLHLLSDFYNEGEHQ